MTRRLHNLNWYSFRGEGQPRSSVPHHHNNREVVLRIKRRVKLAEKSYMESLSVRLYLPVLLVLSQLSKVAVANRGPLCNLFNLYAASDRDISGSPQQPMRNLSNDGTENIFLNIIAHNPTDDFARLVYADWLDERGNEPRAQFIRSEIAISQLPLNDPRRVAAIAERNALLIAHRNTWFPGVTGDIPTERGFASIRSLNFSDLIRRGESLAPYVLDLNWETIGRIRRREDLNVDAHDRRLSILLSRPAFHDLPPQPPSAYPSSLQAFARQGAITLRDVSDNEVGISYRWLDNRTPMAFTFRFVRNENRIYMDLSRGRYGYGYDNGPTIVVGLYRPNGELVRYRVFSGSVDVADMGADTVEAGMTIRLVAQF